MSETLDSIEAELCGCTACELCRERTNIVFGSGPADARIMLVGEAPGKKEDLGGEPFVGSAGRILDEMLERIGLDRAAIYIANTVKCRPPENRDPKPAETSACAPVLEAQIEAIDPAVIVTLGNFATRLILETKDPITELHGQVFEHGGRRVVPAFHPAATIYDRAKRPALESDFDVIGGLL